MKCPHCDKEIVFRKNQYTPEFLQFWDMYESRKRVPSASKSEAMKAWLQVDGSRPDQSILLSATKKYLEYIDKTNSPACHPATWLRQGRYEGFMENAVNNCVGSVEDSTNIPIHSSWPVDLAASLRNEIGENNFKSWFSDVEYHSANEEEGITELLVSSQFRIDHIKKNFARQLYNVVGAFRLVLLE